ARGVRRPGGRLGTAPDAGAVGVRAARRPVPDLMSDRPPAVAGRFYPGQPAALTALVDRLMDEVPDPEPPDPDGLAYVVPHAGYRYSGPTAAYVYARLRTRPRPPVVVLLGPAHFVPLRGCAVPAAERWLPPLGAVPVAVDAIQA